MSAIVNPITHLQQHRDLDTENRQHLAAMMQSATPCSSISALATVRPLPNQEEDPMFPTPEHSPRYTSSESSGYVPFYTSPHHSPSPMQGLDMDPHTMQSHSPNGSYIGGPSSPASDCLDYSPYSSSPYSSPYNTSSPHSIHEAIDCSPHSVTACSSAGVGLNMPVCTGPNSFFTTVTTAGPSYNNMAPLPPVSVLSSEPFPTSATDLENKPCMTSGGMPLLQGSQEFYSSMPHNQHHNFFVEHSGYADSTFGQPPSVMPPTTSSALYRVSSESSIPAVHDGELPIKMVDQIESIAFYDYPPTPESPATRQNTTTVPYNCSSLAGDGVAMSKPLGYPSYLTSVTQHSACPGSFFPRPPMKPTTKARSAKKYKKPAVQVDDSEIKDIPTSAQLWEFTLRVLKKPKYHYMVNWENQQEGLFRFHDAQAFAALWGKHRNRPHMTYDKVARALRYYYKRDILNQVGGRLTYKFSQRLSKLYTTAED